MRTMWFIVLSIFIVSTSYAEPAKTDDSELHKIALKTYIYSILSANSYSRSNNIPFTLQEKIKELNPNILKCKTCKTRKKDKGSGVFNLGCGTQAKVFLSSDKSNNKKPKVVVAFRGTQGIFDWVCGNFRKTQNNKAIKFVKEVREAYPASDYELITTGHSLGGALALETSCLYGAHSYVFNASYHLKKRACKNSSKYDKVNVEEKGDILAIYRFLKKNPKGIENYTFNCIKWRDPVTEHGMEKLASCLIKYAGQTKHYLK